MKSPANPAHFHVDGRMRGCYVYLLLCESADDIVIKIGVAANPIERMRDILVACPLRPEILASVELPNRRRAFRLEHALHRDLAAWRTHGEWFQFSPADKAQFNAAWQRLFRAFEKPGWPLKWTRVNVPELLRQQDAAARSRYRWHVSRGRAYQDFKRAAESDC